MSKQNEQVKPAAFSLADSEPPPPPQASPSASSSKWVIPALAGLVVVAIIVVFLLPALVSTPSTTSGPEVEPQMENVKVAPAKGKSNPAVEEASPWSDAQMAKLRKEAQDVLAILLDVQFELQEMGVEQWAPQPFEDAKVKAAEGDIQYRDRQFVDAKANYDAALANMEALVESAPKALQENLDLARQAIEDGKYKPAIEALAIAAVIAPANPALASLQQRTENLEQLLSIVTKAEEAEKSGDLAQAEKLLKQASELDPDHQKVQKKLARVSQAHTQQRFNDAMSDGYTALDDGKFSSARSAFRNAAKLVPGSAEASAALADVAAAQTSWQLSNYQSSGKKHESNEQWQQAVESYTKALKIDGNLLFAQQGLGRSQSRAQLDKQFRAAIEKPERLFDKTVANATAQLVKQASTITPRGPVLEKQLSTLEVLLKQAGAKIQLTLRSDGETEITLRKVSRLGQFKEKTLTLRPGTYTVIGSRNGYRDVRRTFTVEHDSGTFDILIICTETI